MDRRLLLLPALTLALLASPLAAALCAAGGCAEEPAATSHCAMSREVAGVSVEAASVDCCVEVGAHEPGTVAHGPPVAALTVLSAAPDTPVPSADATPGPREAAVARGGPEALHRLGALLL